MRRHGEPGGKAGRWSRGRRYHNNGGRAATPWRCGDRASSASGFSRGLRTGSARALARRARGLCTHRWVPQDPELLLLGRADPAACGIVEEGRELVLQAGSSFSPLASSSRSLLKKWAPGLELDRWAILGTCRCKGSSGRRELFAERGFVVVSLGETDLSSGATVSVAKLLSFMLRP